MHKPNLLIVLIFMLIAVPSASAQPEFFFESETVGKNVKFLGVQGGSSPLLLRGNCSAITTRCIELSSPDTLVQFDERDLGYITFPARSTRSVILFQAIGRWSFEFFNPGESPGEANVLYDPYFTIESELLNDPRAINPKTGLPMNGSFETGTFTARQAMRSPFGPGERQREGARYFFAAAAVGKDGLRTMGLPEDLVDEFFKQPITIRFHVRGRARFVREGEIAFGVRFMGD